MTTDRMVPRGVPEGGVHHDEEPRCVVADCPHRGEAERLREQLREASSDQDWNASLAGLLRFELRLASEEAADLRARLDALVEERDQALDEPRADGDTLAALVIRACREVSEPRARRAILEDLEATVPGSTDGVREQLWGRE